MSNVAVLSPCAERTAPLEMCADVLEGAPPEAVLRWAVERYADRLTFATGFGAEGCVLIDLIGRHRLPIDLFTLDTGVLFPETRELWTRLEARYGLTIRGVSPERTAGEGPDATLDPAHRLWERDPDGCCARRKVLPLAAELRTVDAWITAIRRDQTPQRANAPVVGWDAKFGIAKVNPLVTWTSRDVWQYLAANDVPYNPLHDRGYPSVGCWPCTSPVSPGEIRAPAGGAARQERVRASRDQPSRCRRRPRRRRAMTGAQAPGRRMTLFPAFLKLAGRRVVVVGGGGVAASKIGALLDAGADVTVVAPEIAPGILQAAVACVRRPFEARDLDDAWFVVAAAPPAVNRRVAEAAGARRLFVNAVDDPPNASLYLGGVVRRSGLTVAISTDGRAPALAGLLRQALDALLPADQVERWLAEADRLRSEWRRTGVPLPERRPQLLDALVRLHDSRPRPAGGSRA